MKKRVIVMMALSIFMFTDNGWSEISYVIHSRDEDATTTLLVQVAKAQVEAFREGDMSLYRQITRRLSHLEVVLLCDNHINRCVYLSNMPSKQTVQYLRGFKIKDILRRTAAREKHMREQTQILINAFPNKNNETGMIQEEQE